jgi:hypothetical protein
MFNCFRRRSTSRALIESDARDLIERYGDNAYSEARVRQSDEARIIDSNRPAGHWERVKHEIKRQQSKK